MSGGTINNNPGPPIIPERRVSLGTPKERERKRRSLPPSAAGTPLNDARRRPSNRVTVKPASPEVISSLIDTLSAISSSTEEHFNSALPNITESHSTPVSPSAWDTHFPKSGSSLRIPPSPLATAFPVSRDSLTESSPQSQASHSRTGPYISLPDRQSRRPSADKSMKYKSREAAYEELLDDAYSIGTPSIERGKALEPSPKQPNQRRSIRSLRSARSLRSLAIKNSTESLPKSDVPVFVAKKELEPKRERLYISDSRSNSPAVTAARTGKHDTPMDAFDLLNANETPQPMSSAKRLYLDSDGTTRSEPSHSRKSSYDLQSAIPTRNSSRRHSANFANRRRRSKQTSELGSTPDNETEAGDDQFHTPPQSPPATITEFDEGSVNRRIEELKEQKAQRERLSVEDINHTLTVPTRTSRSPSPSHISRSRTPEQPSPRTPDFRTPNGYAGKVETPQEKDENEDTAPSPAVRVAPAKTDRNTESTMNALKSKRGSMSSDGTSRPSVPQRTNSKLFKRQPRPLSPSGPEKHKRRFSMGYAPSPPPPPIQQEGNDSVHDAVEDYLSSPRLSQQVANPQTGRVVCFSEVGDPEGSVVFCCVGMGLTRYISCFYDELATTLKLRLITPDRPGVGGSESHADGNEAPLTWPDDVRTICEHRRITKFSILAHSAGAIYALATALRMPQHIRCRVHLLAPWIPPSQMATIDAQQEASPTAAIPYSQRFLRSLPTTFFRAANSSFLGITSNSLTTSLSRTPKKKQRKQNFTSTTTATPTPTPKPTPGVILTNGLTTDDELSPLEKPSTQHHSPNGTDKENRPPLTTSLSAPNPNSQTPSDARKLSATSSLAAEKAARRSSYENRLASRIWDLATTNANPAIDLLVCLERRQPIGFRYVDITRSVVIHHGSKDSRVPVENVRWMGGKMRRCEVRVLEGEGHGLMASAVVMGKVLMEMAGEWEDWNRVVGGGKGP